MARQLIPTQPYILAPFPMAGAGTPPADNPIYRYFEEVRTAEQRREREERWLRATARPPRRRPFARAARSAQVREEEEEEGVLPGISEEEDALLEALAAARAAMTAGKPAELKQAARYRQP